MTERNRRPLFSVIMPLYNKGPYVIRAVDSVLSQTFQDLELIVVDDGSTDGGGDLVEKNCRDPRVLLLRRKNRGVSAARNAGIRKARAPFVAFLDADDEHLPGYLEAIRGLIRRYPKAGTFATGCWVRKHWSLKRRSTPGVPKGFEGILRDYFRLLPAGSPIHTSAVVLRRSLLERTGLFQVGMKNGQDLDLWFRAALEAPVAFLNEPFTIYHLDAGLSAVDAVDRDYSKALRTISKTLLGDRLRPQDVPWVTEYANLVRLKMARGLISGGRSREARELLTGLRSELFMDKKKVLLLSSYFPSLIHRTWRRVRKLV